MTLANAGDTPDFRRMVRQSFAGRVTAVLGPTNTGKTHLAMERMLGHSSGMIGFPLRLLARENYDKIVRIKGKNSVALITGEERIVPPHPSWFVCTVEAMPLDRAVEFLAVDEIQLMGDASRGHVFTERLLSARGQAETMFMGSDTAKPILKRLVPEAEVIARPRFSTLTYNGPRKVTRLPPRSAVVAFAVQEVFELAELVRRQRGGTAVVMGALSPRARNAQVALYQSGEVDYMVATDAIGMGLNMDLDHVAFARLTKFDGNAPRRLTVPEIAQIAGRAGRHMNDGSFGTTAEIGPLDQEIVEAVENHRFDPLSSVRWRNADLDFRSPAQLLRSLEARPSLPILIRMRDADDHLALTALGRQQEILDRAVSRQRVRLLWEVCQIPDFRKVMSDHHARLLTGIYLHLSGPEERLPTDWVAKQLGALDRMDGDIDALVQRIAHIRTWTYITHRVGWLANANEWQAKAIAIEDKLSDALHDRITQRFVDRRSAFLVRKLDTTGDLIASVSSDGEVRVEGHFVGEIRGFRFEPDPAATGEAARTLLAAANRILRKEVNTRADAVSASEDKVFSLDETGTILWQNVPLAQLAAGETLLEPRVELLSANFLEGAARDRVRRRLELFIRDEIARQLPSLFAPTDRLSPVVRGLVYRLRETLGVLDLALEPHALEGIGPDDRKILARMGVRFGIEAVFIDPLLKPRPAGFKAQLWAVHRGRPAPATLPKSACLPATKAGEASLYRLLGYRQLGDWVVRVDRLEAFCAAVRRLAREGHFAPTAELAATLGLSLAQLPSILSALGYRSKEVDGVKRYAGSGRRRHGAAEKRASRPTSVPDDHPFAKLREFAPR